MITIKNHNQCCCYILYIFAKYFLEYYATKIFFSIIFIFFFFFFKIVCTTWLLAVYSVICGHSNHADTTYCLLVHLWPIKLFINTIIYCKHFFFYDSFVSHFSILFLLLYFYFLFEHCLLHLTAHRVFIHLWPYKLCSYNLLLTNSFVAIQIIYKNYVREWFSFLLTYISSVVREHKRILI